MARAKKKLSMMNIFIVVIGLGVVAGLFYMGSVQQTAVEVEQEQVEAVSEGVSVQSIVFNSRNALTFTQEGAGDMELWQLGANPADPNDVGLLDEQTLSSGTKTSTASQEYKSTDDQNTRDLYFEGGGNYYDQKIPEWHISYNEESDKGTLYVNGEAYVEITDIGTFKDMDTADTLGTSFADGGTDSFDYNVTDGTGTSYLRFSIGNSEAKSELREPVLCVGDADGDLEGDELTGLTISQFSGKSIASLDDLDEILQLFTESAGTGGDRCIQFGDVIEGSDTGVYEIEFEWAEANFEANEELEISFDDLGNANNREYPSGNVKATKETIEIARVG